MHTAEIEWILGLNMKYTNRATLFRIRQNIDNAKEIELSQRF